MSALSDPVSHRMEQLAPPNPQYGEIVLEGVGGQSRVKFSGSPAMPAIVIIIASPGTQVQVVEPRYNSLPAEVVAYSENHRILPEVLRAFELAKQHFPTAEKVSVRFAREADTGSEWVEVKVKIEAEVTEFLDKYDQCMREWEKSIPAEALDFLCLTYHLI